jgi:hypothetical protein
MVTLARGTIAPEESRTVPTIFPVSFCAQHRPVKSRRSEHRSKDREVNEEDIANLLAEGAGKRVESHPQTRIQQRQ